MAKIPENTTKNTHSVIAELLFKHENIEKVLDIPSGAGAFTSRLLEKGIEVHSADIENILMVENENFKQSDMNKVLPYSDDYFSNAVCIDGIEHIERPFDFIRECHRVLKNKGTILISTPNISSLRSRWRWFMTGHHNKCKSPLDEKNPTPLHHIAMISFSEIRYLLHTNGFKITSIKTNRIKLISCLYAVFVPLSFLFTYYVYHREEKNKGQKQRNKEILKQVFRAPLLFGETMIIEAECIKSKND